jgi:hypothetical protein
VACRLALDDFGFEDVFGVVTFQSRLGLDRSGRGRGR